MPKSVSSGNASGIDPSKTLASEWLLARVAGPDRAGAILGDLLEISATRGRLWFWIAYARTIVSLGWRTPAGFLCSLACMKLMFGVVLPWCMNHRTSHLMEAGLFGAYNRQVRMYTWDVSTVVAQCLIFVLPFVFVRFGLHDRLTRLACALFLVAVPVYSLRPWLMDLSGVLTGLVIVATLAAPLWRRAMIVLAATCITGVAAVFTFVCILVRGYHVNLLRLPASTMSICDDIGIAIAVIVCAYLHRLLFRRRPTIALAG